MIVLLIVHINLQHLHDRVAPLPTLLSLPDWVRALTAESGPVQVGRISVPDWIDSRQKSNAITLMRETFGSEGHLAFRSPSNLVFYERTTTKNTGSQPHLALQTATGGAANRAEILPTAMENGQRALDRIVSEEWLAPFDDTSPNDTEALESDFRATFPDGVVVDLQKREGRLAARGLEQNLLVGLLPMAMKSLDQGAVMTSVSQRWVSPISQGGGLRLIFILPSEVDGDRFRRWRRTVNTWHAGGRVSEVSHAH